MNTQHVKYLLIGTGGAGAAAGEEIRRRDPQGSILLVGQEHSRPYLRPALSKQFLRRQQNRTEIAIDPVGWYAQKHIELRTGRRVAHLDTARHAITLDNGEEIAFDRLLLATGASPSPLRIAAADLPNVFYLRTIDDCDRLHHAIDQARHEGRAAVIGGGLLAVEAAASLRQMGLVVDLIVSRGHPWSRIAGETTGRFIARYLETHGIGVHVDSPVERLEGDGRVQRVRLKDGRAIGCGFVLAAVGVVPNRELLRGTPIAAEKAILVDDRCRTSVAEIYAAGDCTAVFDPLFGKHRVIDHWDNARLTGTIAGANMAGADERYTGVSSFTSEVFDLRLTVWGDGRFVDRRLVRGSPGPDAPAFAEIGVATDGRVAQVLAVGRQDEHDLFKRLVERRFNVEGREEVLKDPSQELGGVVE